MKKRALLAGLIALVGVHVLPKSAKCQSNSLEATSRYSIVKVPMATATTSLTFEWGGRVPPDQFLIADILSYGGSVPTITPPAGWTLIRDDSSLSTRQSLYWYVSHSNEPIPPSWTFSEPVEVQGGMLLLNNVGGTNPVDMSSGKTGHGEVLTAAPIKTSSDDSIFVFYATDFGAARLGAEIPTNMSRVVDQEAGSHEYWILTPVQSHNGGTDDTACVTAQLFNWVAARVALKPVH